MSGEPVECYEHDDVNPRFTSIEARISAVRAIIQYLYDKLETHTHLPVIPDWESVWMNVEDMLIHKPHSEGRPRMEFKDLISAALAGVLVYYRLIDTSKPNELLQFLRASTEPLKSVFTVSGYVEAGIPYRLDLTSTPYPKRLLLTPVDVFSYMIKRMFETHITWYYAPDFNGYPGELPVPDTSLFIKRLYVDMWRERGQDALAVQLAVHLGV